MDNKTWTPKRVGRSATEVFLLCFMAYACSYVGRQNFSACLPAMLADGTLTKAFGGYIATAYQIVYGSGQLINGIVGSRIRPQYLIGCGLCGAGLMNVCMGLCSLPWMMLVIWSLNGLFHSMLWAPMIRVFTDHLPEDKRDMAGVNIASSIPVGTVCAYLIPALMLKVADWRAVFFVCGGVLLTAFAVWTVCNTLLIGYIRMMEERCREKRARLRAESAARKAENGAGASADPAPAAADKEARPSLVRVILASGLLLVLFCLFCNGGLKDAVTTWAPTFLSQRFGLDDAQSALISVIIPVVSVSGAYVSTWIFKKFIHNELYVGGLMFFISGLCVLGIQLTRNANAVVCAVFLAVLIASMWGANHMFLTLLPYHFANIGMSAAVTGFLNACVYFASAALTTVYGLASEAGGWNVIVLMWAGVALLGVMVCIIGGLVWKKKAAMLDKGELL